MDGLTCESKSRYSVAESDTELILLDDRDEGFCNCEPLLLLWFGRLVGESASLLGVLISDIGDVSGVLAIMSETRPHTDRCYPLCPLVCCISLIYTPIAAIRCVRWYAVPPGGDPFSSLKLGMQVPGE